MPEERSVRWRPSRAGILNVYQYQDEVLEFADGRLLLRGVNGSGKSTAMNMLLPFLLEADVRKIDAAGEQRGVLRSWMLSDNDDTQRTGYLWIEFERAGEFRTVGCGIRASRSTDRVTTWWFSTDRRVRVDLRLTEAEVPFSVEALRAELGDRGQVFGSTAEYRAEVARRFFGGTDPSAYFRLLHQVRNPRVGDRIDADLPRTLREALPPVPEDAVNDAAQPLEDLEQYRRDVIDLVDAERALSEVVEVYTDYARRVLQTAVEGAGSAVDGARSAGKALERARDEAERSDAARDRSERAVADLVDEQERAGAERTGLISLPEYTAHADLVRRRDELARAEGHVRALDEHRERARERVVGAAERAGAVRGQVDSDLAVVASHLAALAGAVRAGAVRVRLPDPPAVVTELRRDEAGDTSVDVPELADDAAAWDPTADLPEALTLVDDALRTHRTAVRGLREHLAVAERDTTTADRAATESNESSSLADEAVEEAETAAAAARDTADAHAHALALWRDRLVEHVTAVPRAEPDGPSGWLTVPEPAEQAQDDDLRRRAETDTAGARAAADAVTSAVTVASGQATARADAVRVDLSALREEHDRVADAAELPLPRAPWRRDVDVADGELLASVVDFADGLDDEARAGLEAALEASGLLAARVTADGELHAADGRLLARPGAGRPAGPDLGHWLLPVDTGLLPVDLVAGVLAGVGTTPGGALWVATDGSFGVGPLTGRHGKPAAEYVGAGARSRARERRLAELSVLIGGAEARLAAAESVTAALLAHGAALRELVTELPPTRPVAEAVAASGTAGRFAAEARRRASERAEVAEVARARADEAWARAQQEATRTGLPTDATRLDELLEAVGDAERAAAAAEGAAERARRSGSSWREAVASWEVEADAHAQSASASRHAAGEAEAIRVEIETVAEALGEEPAEIARRVAEIDEHLRALAGRLDGARKAETAAAVEAAQAGSRVQVAHDTRQSREADVHVARARLAAALEVPGLLAAAERGVEPPDGPSGDVGPEGPELVEHPPPDPAPATPDTVDGTSELVAVLRRRLPAPRAAVSEDALDKALRATRDGLASGWDVESRRAGDGSPLAVHVSGSGPRAVLAEMVRRVAVQRRKATSLLSAQQDRALRNLLHGRIAREVADALLAARELVDRMNDILRGVTSSQGIGVRLDWRPRSDLDPDTATALSLLAKEPDLRTPDQDDQVREAVRALVEQARTLDPEASYRSVIAEVLDYRTWHEMRIYLRRPGRNDELLTRRSTLSEGEKKLVTVLPMAASASASAAAHDPHDVGSPRLMLLDDAFAKVSEDNHAKLFGLLVDLDVDFVVTSERLWGTHPNVPALAITEVLRDPELRAIALVHYRWDGASLAVRA